MNISLTDEEIRVLGCLMEKEMATPEYYPLSLNALTNACNQKSNREPVTSYDENTVAEALSSLRKKKLAMESSGSRVPRYAHTFSQEYKLTGKEEAVICILLVRGPQTIGEIRGRTERLYTFTSLDEVRDTIGGLENMGLVKKLPKQPGRKESRYAHLFGGALHESIDAVVSMPEDTAVSDMNEYDNINELNDEIAVLREELRSLRMEFEAFKAMFS